MGWYEAPVEFFTSWWGRGPVGTYHMRHGWVVDFEALDRDFVEGGVVEHHHTVRVEREAFHGQEGVVGLDHDVRLIVPVRENGVGLDELLRKVVVQLLEEERTHTRTGTWEGRWRRARV